MELSDWPISLEFGFVVPMDDFLACDWVIRVITEKNMCAPAPANVRLRQNNHINVSSDILDEQEYAHPMSQ